MNRTSERRIRFKCRYEGEIRTVTVTPDTEFSELKRRLSSDYGFDVSLKYEDRDGDTIILASQNDLDDIFLYGDADTINVFVSETLSLPNLQLKGSLSSSRLGTTPLLLTGNSATVASLYTTGTVNNSTLASSNNYNSINSTRDSQKPSNVESTYVSNTVKSQSMLRPINGSRMERFPIISENTSHNKHHHNENVNIRWKKAEMLGQGAFGVVYLGLNIDSGELMAVKQMATEDVSKRELSSLENEIHLLRNLRHPNIVRYIGTELNPESMSIFLEYVPGGSLKALIDKFGSLEESVAKSYTRQLLVGLEYLHRHGIAHRDIKGANCLVGNDGVIKLADFGNSKHWRPINATASIGAAGAAIPAQASSGDIKGTPSWMAPEVIRDEGSISWRKADIWSLGCTTLEMTTGKAPWSQFNNPVTILYHIACQDTLPQFPDPASIELITFLNTCLQREPKQRPDVTSLLMHPFVSHVSVPGLSAASSNSGTWAGGGAPPGAQFQNRPSTVSHSVVGEWDRASHQQSLFANTSTHQQQQSGREYSALDIARASSVSEDLLINGPGDSSVHSAQADRSSSSAQWDGEKESGRYQRPLSARGGSRGSALTLCEPELMLEVDQHAQPPPHALSAEYQNNNKNNNDKSDVSTPVALHQNQLSDHASDASITITRGGSGGAGSKQSYPARLVALNHSSASPRTFSKTNKNKNNSSNAHGRNSPVTTSALSPGNGAATGGSGDHKANRERKKEKVRRQPQQQHPDRATRTVESPSLSPAAVIREEEAREGEDAQLAHMLMMSEQNMKFAAGGARTSFVNEDEIDTPPTTLQIPKLDLPGVMREEARRSAAEAEASLHSATVAAGKFSGNASLGDFQVRPDELDDDSSYQQHLIGVLDQASSRSTRSGVVFSSDANTEINNNNNLRHHLQGSPGKKQHRRGGGGDKLRDFESFDSTDNSSWYSSLRHQQEKEVEQDGDSLTAAADDDTLFSADLYGGYSSTEGDGMTHHSRDAVIRSEKASTGGSPDMQHTRIYSSFPHEAGEFASRSPSTDRKQKRKGSSRLKKDAAAPTVGGKLSVGKQQVITGPTSWKRINSRGNTRSQSELIDISSVAPNGKNGTEVAAGGTSVINPTALSATAVPSGWRRQQVSSASNALTLTLAESEAVEGPVAYNSHSKAGTYGIVPDGMNDFYSAAEEVTDDPDAILHDDLNASYEYGRSQHQHTAQPPRSGIMLKSTAKSTRDKEKDVSVVQFDSDATSNEMSVSGINIDTMRLGTATGSLLGTPHASHPLHSRSNANQGMRSSSSRKSLDPNSNSAAAGMSRTGSRQPLRTASKKQRDRDREKEKDIDKDNDLLDMSCDSLDKLHITGTSAAAGNNSIINNNMSSRGETANYSEREGSGRATRQSKRGFTAIPSSSASSRRYDDASQINLSAASADYEDEVAAAGVFSNLPISLDEHTAAVSRLRAPEKTNLLLSSSLDGTIRIWGPEMSAADDMRSRAVLEASGFKTDNTYSAFADARPERRITLGAGAGTGAGDDGSLTGGSTARGPTLKISNFWVDEACETIWGTCSDAAIRVWSGGEGRPLRLLRGHEDQITAMEGMDAGSSSTSHLLQSSVSGNPSSCLLATGSADRTVRVWDARAKKAQVFSFRGHGDTVLVLRWGEGGRSLVSAGKDKTVRIWDTRAGRLRVTLEKHFGSVSCIRVLSGQSNSIGTSTGGGGGGVNSSKGEGEIPSIVSAGRDSMINIWSGSGDCLSSQAAHRGTVSFLSDINYPSTQSCGAGYSSVYNATLGLNSKCSYTRAFSGSPLMLSLGTDGMIRLWDLRRYKCISEVAPPTVGKEGNCTKAVWCAQGFVTGNNLGSVRLYEHSAGVDANNVSLGMTRDIRTAGYDHSVGGGEYLARSGSGSPSAVPYGAAMVGPGTASLTSSQDWVVRELAVHGAHGTQGAQGSSSCTDLICTEAMCASASKSGQILRWTKL